MSIHSVSRWIGANTVLIALLLATMSKHSLTPLPSPLLHRRLCNARGF